MQTVDLEKTTNITPDVDQLVHEKLQEGPKLSTEGEDFFAKEILESQNFLTVSIEKSSTYLASSNCLS